MRVSIVSFCAAVAACTPLDQRPIESKAPIAVAATAAAPTPVVAEPVAPAWAPILVPGDTTPQGGPTETALLRWVYRFPPDSFPELPKPVRDSLAHRGCQIPTPGAFRRSVVTGAFTVKGAVEWAILCSVQDTSQILIFNAGNGAVVDSLGRGADSGWIQGNGNNTWLFSRVIGIVSMRELNIIPIDTTSEYTVYYGRMLPKPIDHDGVYEWFLDKASTTYYFAQGRWIDVGTSD